MFEELAETVFPGGAFVAIGLTLGAAFGEQLRPLAKQVVKAGMAVADQVQAAAAEAYERSQDLVAEARQERENAKDSSGGPSLMTSADPTPPASSRGRRSPSLHDSEA